MTGSVVGVMNNSWTIVQSYRYDLWWNGEVQDGTWVWKKFDAYTWIIIAGSALWTSREYDKDINKYYLRNRRYDPHTSRFLTRDPLGYKDDVNMYRYVANSPLMYTDPMGTVKTLACINNFQRGVVYGDFAWEWWGCWLVGQIVWGEVFGLVSDARDLIAGANSCTWLGGCGVSISMGVVAFIPWMSAAKKMR
jgi:RHS repeat-associated protein